MTLQPMEHTGDSANIAFYRERGAKPGTGSVWAEVLRSAIARGPDGEWIRVAPTYYVTVYREGHGEIGETKTTRALGHGPRLPDRAVSALVRQVVAS
jgi:hypothetical protein